MEKDGSIDDQIERGAGSWFDFHLIISRFWYRESCESVNELVLMVSKLARDIYTWGIINGSGGVSFNLWF